MAGRARAPSTKGNRARLVGKVAAAELRARVLLAESGGRRLRRTRFERVSVSRGRVLGGWGGRCDSEGSDGTVVFREGVR